MSNIQQIQTSLSSLLKSEMPFVAMISGEWGIGKTYFWKDFAEKEKLDRVAYISLFGHNSLEDIKLAIMTEVGMIQHDKFKGFIERTKDLQVMGVGVGVGGFFSMFTKEDLSKIVICFDDFERLSNKLDIKDEKECKVIMILNEDELDHDHENGNKRSEIFTRKKEKIVDYSFYYNQTHYFSFLST